jgi:hypothetical protein
MNWTAIAAIGQLAAAAAVLVTLVYLARQVRQSNRQAFLSALRHAYDSLNDWGVALFQSEAVSAIVLRGRKSYEGLTDAERFRFDQVHLMFLNIVESHYHQMQQTALDDEYRRWATENLAALVRAYLDFPGTQQFWKHVQAFFEPGVQRLVAENTGDA